MKSFLKNLLALTGLVSIITVLGSLAYVDKKLHDFDVLPVLKHRDSNTLLSC